MVYFDALCSTMFRPREAQSSLSPLAAHEHYIPHHETKIQHVVQVLVLFVPAQGNTFLPAGGGGGKTPTARTKVCLNSDLYGLVF